MSDSDSGIISKVKLDNEEKKTSEEKKNNHVKCSNRKEFDHHYDIEKLTIGINFRLINSVTPFQTNLFTES